jgi:hypothetical protein
MQGFTVRCVNLNKSYGEVSDVSHTDTSQYNTAYDRKWIKITETGLILFTERSGEYSVLFYGAELYNLSGVEFPIFMELTYPCLFTLSDKLLFLSFFFV